MSLPSFHRFAPALALACALAPAPKALAQASADAPATNLALTARLATWYEDSYRRAPGQWGIAVADQTGRVLWSRPGYAPQWSPDGRRLAFETPKGAVALATPSGRVIRRLGRQIDGHAWLPDGRHLALVGRRIWVVTTTGRIVFTSPADADAVVWSRDGRRIAYRARAGIFVARLGGRPRRVSRAGSWPSRHEVVGSS